MIVRHWPHVNIIGGNVSVSFCESQNRIRMQNCCDMFLHSGVLVLQFMLMLELTVIRQINIFVIWNVETQSCWLQVLIIGAGPCGLRTAIEAQLLGAKVVIVEKRDRISRNNVLHLWPFVIQDLRALGAKKFFGKFCAGSIDHISKCVNTTSYGSSCLSQMEVC